MKQKDIKVGGVYWTRVSGEMLQVKVLSIVDRSTGLRAKTRFLVQRLDNGRVLTKHRSSSALHETKHPGYASVTTIPTPLAKEAEENEDFRRVLMANERRTPSEEAFNKLYMFSGDDRDLCDRWNAFVKANRSTARTQKLREDRDFLKLYASVMEATNVPAKRRAITACLAYAVPKYMKVGS